MTLFEIGDLVQDMYVYCNREDIDHTDCPCSHNFVETDHEVISAVILPLLLIQEEQLSFTGKSMCTSTG